MIAYVYRSGHVMIGRNVPDGAIELVSCEQEETLELLLRYFCRTLVGQDGTLQLVASRFNSPLNEGFALNVMVTPLRDNLKLTLQQINSPHEILRFAAPPLAKWSPEAIEMVGAE